MVSTNELKYDKISLGIIYHLYTPYKSFDRKRKQRGNVSETYVCCEKLKMNVAKWKEIELRLSWAIKNKIYDFKVTGQS